jgi:hypothetical protein
LIRYNRKFLKWVLRIPGCEISFALGCLIFNLVILSKTKYFVNHAGSIPQYHFPACLLHQVSTKVFIRREDDGLVFRHAIDDIGGIAAGTDDITLRFYVSRAVDVANHDMTRVLFLNFLNSSAGALSASEQPAFRSGNSTFLEGFKILAVSAMKWTPAIIFICR